MRLERASVKGEIVECKSELINGVPVGIVRGHIATWQEDSYKGMYGVPDVIHPGAYLASIEEHKARANRQVRLKDNHFNTIGGFPISSVYEDGKGLFGEGHINLETQQGKEAYSLARQGVLVDFSVGHIVKEEKLEGGKRHIYRADLIEGSITDEPKNQGANILEVKSFADLPIVSGDYDWDPDAAKQRVLEMKFAEGNPNDAFIGGQQVADFVEGKLLIVPEALHAAASEIKAGGNIRDQITAERYFAKIGVPSPFETKTFHSVEEVKSWSQIDLQKALVATGAFSNGAARALVASYHPDDVPTGDTTEIKSLLESLNSIKTRLTTR